MENEENIKTEEKCCEFNFSKDKLKSKSSKTSGFCGGVYGFGLIGAAIYFIQHAETFWIGVLGVLKAIIWPVILIYQLLEFLN